MAGTRWFRAVALAVMLALAIPASLRAQEKKKEKGDKDDDDTPTSSLTVAHQVASFAWAPLLLCGVFGASEIIKDRHKYQKEKSDLLIEAVKFRNQLEGMAPFLKQQEGKIAETHAALAVALDKLAQMDRAVEELVKKAKENSADELLHTQADLALAQWKSRKGRAALDDLLTLISKNANLSRQKWYAKWKPKFIEYQEQLLAAAQLGVTHYNDVMTSINRQMAQSLLPQSFQLKLIDLDVQDGHIVPSLIKGNELPQRRLSIRLRSAPEVFPIDRAKTALDTVCQSIIDAINSEIDLRERNATNFRIWMGSNVKMALGVSGAGIALFDQFYLKPKVRELEDAAKEQQRLKKETQEKAAAVQKDLLGEVASDSGEKKAALFYKTTQQALMNNRERIRTHLFSVMEASIKAKSKEEKDRQLKQAMKDIDARLDRFADFHHFGEIAKVALLRTAKREYGEQIKLSQFLDIVTEKDEKTQDTIVYDLVSSYYATIIDISFRSMENNFSRKISDDVMAFVIKDALRGLAHGSDQIRPGAEEKLPTPGVIPTGAPPKPAPPAVLIPEAKDKADKEKEIQMPAPIPPVFPGMK